MTLKAVKAAACRRRNPPQPGFAIRNPDPQSSAVVRSVALTVLAVLAIILVLQYAQAMIIPIVLGVLISYALEPFVAVADPMASAAAAGGRRSCSSGSRRRAAGSSTAFAAGVRHRPTSCPTARGVCGG